MNVNLKQMIQIIGVIISVATVSSAQLTDLLGPGIAKTIVTIAGLLNMTLQGIAVQMNTQTNQVKDVRSMPGVDHIDVNASASPALASLAVDAAETKIGATTPEVRTALVAKAAA
jgi:hypothetical protein